MKLLYQNQITRRNMRVEYLLYRTQDGYTAEVRKYEGETVETASHPLDSDQKESLRLIKALQKSRVTPYSLHEALEDRYIEE